MKRHNRTTQAKAGTSNQASLDKARNCFVVAESNINKSTSDQTMPGAGQGKGRAGQGRCIFKVKMYYAEELDMF
jgi:hypothetical protein